MSNMAISKPDSVIVEDELITSLLNQLHNCFGLFQDGVVDDDTFVGGLPLSYLNADGSLEALTFEESRQIKRALIDSPLQPKRALDFSFPTLLKWMHLRKSSDEEQIENGGEAPSQAIIGADGRLLPLPEGTNPNNLIQDRLNARGLPRFGSYWIAIIEKLNTKRREEKSGDLSLIDIDRIKLAAGRLNATPFEQEAQKFAAHVPSLFCDADGDVFFPVALEKFTDQLVELLLEKTKPYWPIAPLLSIFDAVVVPVLRPMLYPHTTWAGEYNFFSDSGVFDVRQFANKRTALETTPGWSKAAQEQALRFIEEALKKHLSLKFFGLRFFDVFSPYNREIHSSVHMDPSAFNGKTKTFGPPVHAQDVMQLIQPVRKKPEEALVEKVMTYRSSEEGVWY